MPFVNSTSGRDPSFNECPKNPYILSAADAYRGRIELAAGVSISVQVHGENSDLGPGVYAWANADSCHDYAGGMTTRTKANAWANSETAALDSVAKQLGVFEQLNPNHANTNTLLPEQSFSNKEAGI